MHVAVAENRLWPAFLIVRDTLPAILIVAPPLRLARLRVDPHVRVIALMGLLGQRAHARHWHRIDNCVNRAADATLTAFHAQCPCEHRKLLPNAVTVRTVAGLDESDIAVVKVATVEERFARLGDIVVTLRCVWHVLPCNIAGAHKGGVVVHRDGRIGLGKCHGLFRRCRKVLEAEVVVVWVWRRATRRPRERLREAGRAVEFAVAEHAKRPVGRVHGHVKRVLLDLGLLLLVRPHLHGKLGILLLEARHHHLVHEHV